IKALRGHHTIILSTHILSEVEATCEKVIIINNGEIVAEDSIQNLSTMEKGQSRLHIRVRKDIEDMRSILSGVNNVVAVHAGASQKEWNIDLKGGEEVVENISSLLVTKGYGLVELSPSKVDLEDVFLKLTYGKQQESVHREGAQI
ncbi:MAG: ABC transporter ATP-binding protein, partial [Bdellovibrio sp.]